MNKLVEYLDKYHNPGGNSVNIVSVDDLIFEMELTRAELFDLANDPKVKKILTPKYNGKDTELLNWCQSLFGIKYTGQNNG